MPPSSSSVVAGVGVGSSAAAAGTTRVRRPVGAARLAAGCRMW
jgi:hypothetical protein